MLRKIYIVQEKKASDVTQLCWNECYLYLYFFTDSKKAHEKPMCATGYVICKNV